MRARTVAGARAAFAGFSIALALGLSDQVVASPPQGVTEQSVVVDPVTYDAKIAPRDQQLLQGRFEEGLARAGFEASEGATQRVKATVTEQEGDFRVEVTMVEEGEAGVSLDEVCELCGIEELGELLTAMGGRLRRKMDLMRDTALLRIETRPRGAQVRVDGEAVGTTPVEVPIQPGTRKVEVSKPGHRTEKRTIEAAAGTRENYSLVLVRGGYQTWLPWTLLATGVVGVASGATLIAIDGNEIRSDCNADPLGNCQFLHKTLGGGVALTVIGIGLVATGAALAVKWRSRKGTYARRLPYLQITGTGVQGRF
jgi:hypothetical protein